jgi:geranylgeranyl pyrophosphate synthase
MFGSVLDRAEAYALERAVAPEQRNVFETAFASVRAKLNERGVGVETLDSVRIPRLVHAAVRGDELPALPLAVSLTVLYVGMDLWDSVMDRELGREWHYIRPEEVSLAAAALIGGIAPLALCEINAPPATIVAIQSALARAFTTIAAGQQRDLALTDGDHATAEAAIAATDGKSGAVVGLFAETAALLAGAPRKAVVAYSEMGHALGMAAQLRSDLYDIFGDPNGKDLPNGARTLPVALYLESLNADARVAFLALLTHARTNARTRDDIRERLHRADTVRACAVFIEAQCVRASQALVLARAKQPSCNQLRRLIDCLSFVQDHVVDPW